MNSAEKAFLFGLATAPVFHGINAVSGDYGVLEFTLKGAFIFAGLRQALLSSETVGTKSGEGVRVTSGDLGPYAKGIGFGWAASAAVGAVFPGDADQYEPSVEDIGGAYHEMHEPTFAESLDPVQRAYFNQLEQG